MVDATKEPQVAPGVVYTRPWVVKFMLDLADYREEYDLAAGTILEPGCGSGEFLVEIVRRLLSSATRHGRPLESLTGSIVAFDLDASALAVARHRVSALLHEAGLSVEASNELVGSWLREGDFLLARLGGLKMRWVVGNPPYVRVEELDPDIYAAYRARWSAMSGRADIYVGFFQASLALLEEDGVLVFICADRWMHNQYGAGLRKLIIEEFAVDVVLEVHDVEVFESRVAAYPAITLLRRGRHIRTALATANADFEERAAQRLSRWLADSPDGVASDDGFTAAMLDGSFVAGESWPSGPPERLALIADIEDRFSTITEVGITIGVGMATGADRVYVSSAPGGIEADRLRRAVGPADITEGRITWKGRYILSPWRDGKLVELEAFPALAAHFQLHSKLLKSRYVAQKHENDWWRTIDRPRPDEYAEPKLVVADINDKIEPVLDTEGYWPLHSAYFIKSETWDLEVLGGYLLSDVAAAFVEAYSVRMAGGHLRISSQYLRKIRAPRYEDVSDDDRHRLSEAFRNRDRASASRTVRGLLGLA